MADNKINSTVESLFKGMNEFIASKTVVGEPVRVGDTTIIPLVEVFLEWLPEPAVKLPSRKVTEVWEEK